jgi:hypothetical protein
MNSMSRVPATALLRKVSAAVRPMKSWLTQAPKAEPLLVGAAAAVIGLLLGWAAVSSSVFGGRSCGCCQQIRDSRRRTAEDLAVHG